MKARSKKKSLKSPLTEKATSPFAAKLQKMGYEMKQFMGMGNWGLVYKCYHQRLRFAAAVKILKPEFWKDEEVVRDFIGEA